MKKLITKYSIYAFIWLTILYPLFIAGQNSGWQAQEGWATFLFPFFGLLMVSLLWLHAMSGSFEEWLRQYINFDLFVEITAKIILACLVLHPLLALASFSFNLGDLYDYYGKLFIWAGIISWILLISYDIFKPFKQGIFKNHWNKILIISNIGFIISFYHAINLGSDLQSGSLKYLWAFFGTTAILSIIYTYAIKPWIKK